MDSKISGQSIELLTELQRSFKQDAADKSRRARGRGADRQTAVTTIAWLPC